MVYPLNLSTFKGLGSFKILNWHPAFKQTNKQNDQEKNWNPFST